MEWNQIAGDIAKYAPIVGGILGGPPGAALGSVGSMIASALGVANTPDDVSVALATNPDAAVKLKAIEADHQVQLASLSMQAAANQLTAETNNLAAVNQTMQVETKSEHWSSYMWRPFCGFVFGTLMLGDYFVLPLMHIPVPVIPPEAWMTLGAVLGIASFFRGKAQADVNNPAQVSG